MRLADPPSVAHIDFDALDDHRFADGGGFPPSYREFVRQAGWGRTFGLWLIYPPVLPGHADGWHGRAAVLTERFHAAYEEARAEEFDWLVEPDGDWSVAASLHVFGWSENGDALLWQTSARGADGEFPVWESRSLGSLHRLGDDLRHALPGLKARAEGLFGPRAHDVEPLEPARLD